MQLKLDRFLSDKDTTIGALYINGQFECYTLEDEFREVKVMGETRIPQGDYEIKLHTYGQMNDKYKLKFPEHKGMLEITKIPNFSNVYFHIGNKDEDTRGCILVGTNYDKKKMILTASTIAYRKFYPKVVEGLAHENVFLTIDDLDR